LVLFLIKEFMADILPLGLPLRLLVAAAGTSLKISLRLREPTMKRLPHCRKSIS
jgi:hypothetical protein